MQHCNKDIMFGLKFLIFISATVNLISLSFCQQCDWEQYDKNKVNCEVRSVPLDLKDSQSTVG